MKNYTCLILLMLGVFMKTIDFKSLPFVKYFVFSISTMILISGIGLVAIGILHAIAPNGLIH